jgi:hypothetical protein
MLRQKDQEFKVSLGYIGRPCIRTIKRKKKKEEEEGKTNC